MEFPAGKLNVTLRRTITQQNQENHLDVSVGDVIECNAR